MVKGLRVEISGFGVKLLNDKSGKWAVVLPGCLLHVSVLSTFCLDAKSGAKKSRTAQLLRVPVRPAHNNQSLLVKTIHFVFGSSL